MLLCRDTNTLVRLGVVSNVVGRLVVALLLVLKSEVCNDDVMHGDFDSE